MPISRSFVWLKPPITRFPVIETSKSQVTFDTDLADFKRRSIQNTNDENGHPSSFLFVSSCISVSRAIRRPKTGPWGFNENIFSKIM